jgi:trigger factor
MVEYTATADIIPEVKLGDFKKLGVKKPEAKVSAKDINAVLEDIRSSFADKKVAKKAAENGDEVIIDFVGKKDGEAFKGGTAKDYRLVLGSKTFIPGFEEGIVGHQSGDKFDLKLTFPKDYGVKDLAGAKTVFEVLVKQVNEVKKPALDDDLAQKCGPFKTLDELKADIKKNLEQQDSYKLIEQFKDDLIKALVKKSKIPAPEILIDDQMRAIRDDMTRNAESQNMSFEEFLEANGETKENWEKEARKIAEERVKASLALQTLAVEQKITVSDDAVAAKIAELRDVYKKSPEALKQLKDPNIKTNIKNRLIIESTMDLLVKENSK